MSIAFLFPGQGSQSQNMLADIAPVFTEVAQTFQEASDGLNYDLWDIVCNNFDGKLNQTQHTQPALLTASVALWRIINNNKSLQPTFFAGHSLGEYSALVCANALSFIDAVRCVSSRGEFMQQAVPQGEGAMAAIIGLENDKVAQLCEQASQGQIVTPANFNAIGQVVIAGSAQAVNRCVDLAKNNGAKIAKLIPVSVPSHCALMKPASTQLATVFDDINFTAPSTPVIQNFDVQMHDQPDHIKTALLAQLDNPVRWVETVQHMANNRVDTMIECGPGKVLSGLIKRIDRNVTTINIGTLDGLTQFLEQA